MDVALSSMIVRFDFLKVGSIGAYFERTDELSRIFGQFSMKSFQKGFGSPYKPIVWVCRVAQNASKGNSISSTHSCVRFWELFVSRRRCVSLLGIEISVGSLKGFSKKFTKGARWVLTQSTWCVWYFWLEPRQSFGRIPPRLAVSSFSIHDGETWPWVISCVTPNQT